MKPGGYVALYRSIFDNKDLDDEQFSRREAWIWLFSTAAWVSTIHTVDRGTVNVGRGQLAVSLRTLAKKWGWKLGRTQRFIAFLRRKGMITLELVGTSTDSLRAVRCMVISICNYSKLQSAAEGKKGQKIRGPLRQTQEKMPFVYALRHEEPNNQIDSSLSESRQFTYGRKRVPKAGKRSVNGTIFIPLNHEQYPLFAADYREATGEDPNPEKDGGNWFWPAGEASRPANLIHLRGKRPA